MKPVLLYVDDRPSSLTKALFDRDDVIPVLLRFSHLLLRMDSGYLKATEHYKSFVLDTTKCVQSEAIRFSQEFRGAGVFPEFFLNHSEPMQETSHSFARELGLPSLCPQQVLWVRDKLAMKQKFSDLGFLVARHRPVSNHAEIIDFAKEVGYPIVIKPRDQFSCIGTHSLKTENDVLAVDLCTKWEWLVEDFIPDREYECCALIAHSQVLKVFPVWLPAPVLASTEGAINASISLRHTPIGWPICLENIIQRLVDGMRIDHGYMHLDFFLNDCGICTLGEVALRLAGIEIPMNHSLSYGIHVYNALIDIHIGRQPSMEVTEDRFVGDLLLPLKSGRITRMTPLSKLLELDGVIEGRYKVQVGEFLEPQRAAHSSAGYVHVCGDSVNEVEERMYEVINTFELYTDNC